MTTERRRLEGEGARASQTLEATTGEDSSHGRWEGQPPHRNWPIVLVFNLITILSLSIMTPSLYQFITLPRSPSAEQEADGEKFWPGLGESETFYAGAVMVFAIGEVAAVLFAGAIAEKLPYTLTLVLPSILIAIGGALYGLAVEGWMVKLARLFFGFGAAFKVVGHAYIGEFGTLLDNYRRKRGKCPIKYVLYFALSFVITGGFFVAFGVTSIVAQFPDVSPYRWPGWFITTVAVVYVVVVILAFKETHRCGFVMKQVKWSSCVTGIKLSLQLKRFSKTRFVCYVFLVSVGYAIGQSYSLILTLVTPILSDQFGFSVAYTSHYLIGVSVVFFGAFILQVVIKVLKMNNRIMLGVALIMCLVGSILVGDWQTIGYAGREPCSSAGANATNTTGSLANNTEPEDTVWLLSASGSPLDSNSSDYQLLVESCEAQSSSGHQCFWNPESRITGEFCNTCRATCLSREASINFYQFSAGMFLIALASPLKNIVISAITSDVTAIDSQGTALSLVLGSQSVARIVSPFWFVETYEASGKHTYPSMAVMSVMLLVLLLALAALYKNLAPKSVSYNQTDASVRPVNPLYGHGMELTMSAATEDN